MRLHLWTDQLQNCETCPIRLSLQLQIPASVKKHLRHQKIHALPICYNHEDAVPSHTT